MQNEPSHLTSSIHTELEGFHSVITADVSERVKAQKLLSNLLKALDDENYDIVGQLLDKGELLISNIYPQVKPTLLKLHTDVYRQLDEQLRLTCSQLEDYCHTEDIQIKSSGTKYVVDYYIDVEFDRKKGRVQIGNFSLNTLKWAKVKDALENERARLWKREFYPDHFRDQIIAVYKQIAATSSAATDWISLEEIYQILKRIYKK